MMNSITPTFIMLSERRARLLLIVFVQLIVGSSCSNTNQMYTVDEQYELSKDRASDLKEALDFSFELENQAVHVGETIFFIAYFRNNTDDYLTVRLPQQSGVLDINHANTRLKYSLTPLDDSISLLTPLEYLGTPYIFSNPVESSEFVTLDPHALESVNLKLQNSVYLKQDEAWVESNLPAGEYLLDMTYQNLYIGYEVEQNGHIYIVDKSAWVGQIEAEPVTLTVLP